MATRAPAKMTTRTNMKGAVPRTLTLTFGTGKKQQCLYRRLMDHTKTISNGTPNKFVLDLLSVIYGTIPNPPEEWKDLPLICAFSAEPEHHINEIQYRIQNLQGSLKSARSTLKEARARLRQMRCRTNPAKRVRGGDRRRVVRAV